MPIRESQIETSMLAPELGLTRIPVLYTDEFIDTVPAELALSSVGGILPYLFAGYFTNSEGEEKWYFSNARRHQEMKEAIEQDNRKKYNYIYGQIWFNEEEQEKGVFIFDRLILHGDLPDKDKAELLLRKTIDPHYLTEDFSIKKARF